VLIIRNDAVGDLVVTTPILSLLAEVAPQAEVDVLASTSNRSLIAADQRVHHVYVNPKTRRGWLALMRTLRARRYDLIYSLRYGRALREGLISGLAAAVDTQKVSVFRPKRYHGLFTRVVRTPRRATHMAERLLHVAASAIDLGADTEVSLARYPIRLAISPAAEAVALDFLTAHDVKEFVIVNFSARESERDWPAASCARLIDGLASRHHDLTFVLTAPSARSDEASTIVRECRGQQVVAFPPSTDLLALAALIQRARLVITPDTAAVHLAAATGRPVLGLYMQLKTRLWVPLGVPYRLVEAPAGAPIATIPEATIADAFEELYAETSRRTVSR
jgi:ADP-heptose:LPS heptosyltransferase